MKFTPSLGPEPPRHFRTFAYAGTVVDTNFLIPESASVDMSGCPEDTCPGRLIIHHESDVPVDLVLTGEDDAQFTLTIPGAPVAGAGVTYPFEGGVQSVVAAGSGAIQSIVACWWTGSRMPRRTTTP